MTSIVHPELEELFASLDSEYSTADTTTIQKVMPPSPAPEIKVYFGISVSSKVTDVTDTVIRRFTRNVENLAILSGYVAPEIHVDVTKGIVASFSINLAQTANTIINLIISSARILGDESLNPAYGGGYFIARTSAPVNFSEL